MLVDLAGGRDYHHMTSIARPQMYRRAFQRQMISPGEAVGTSVSSDRALGFRTMPVGGPMEVCVFDPCCSIRSEIYQACLKLGADSHKAQEICFANIPEDIYRACALLGAGPELLSILSSYGDTLDDSDVLTFLQAYNAGKPVIVDLICNLDAE